MASGYTGLRFDAAVLAAGYMVHGWHGALIALVSRVALDLAGRVLIHL